MLCKTVSSLQPDVGRGFLHVSNVFLLPKPMLTHDMASLDHNEFSNCKFLRNFDNFFEARD